MISVIMPVYNTKQYLEQAIESVLYQTFQDWELILVDDGSTDGSGEMCDYYVKKDCRICVIHQNNKGVSEARNTGMKHASGEFIQFLDSDDWLYPETLRTAYEVATSSGSDMVIFDAQYESKDFSWHEKSTIPDGIYDSEVILAKLAEPSIPPYTWNKFCRRSLYEGSFFPKDEKWEDVAVTFYPVFRAKKITVLGKPLYHYRQRKDAITKQAIKNKSIYMWRFLQYRKRYEFLKVHSSHIADIAKPSVLKNGLLYYAFLLRGNENDKVRVDVYQYLCSTEFDGGSYSKKIKIARALFKLCPELAAFIIRKKFEI